MSNTKFFIQATSIFLLVGLGVIFIVDRVSNDQEEYALRQACLEECQTTKAWIEGYCIGFYCQGTYGEETEYGTPRDSKGVAGPKALVGKWVEIPGFGIRLIDDWRHTIEARWESGEPDFHIRTFTHQEADDIGMDRRETVIIHNHADKRR